MGRTLERAILTEQLERVAHGSAVSVLLRGEAGIGKSTILTTVTEEARTLGYTILHARADEFDRGIPFSLFRDAMHQLDASGLTTEMRMHAEALRDELATALTPGPTDSDSLRLVFARANAFLLEAVRTAPTVVAFEDLHLADPDSIALITLLVRHLAGEPVLFLASLRPGGGRETSPMERLVERLGFEGRGVVVDLEPFDRNEVRLFINASLGATPDGALIDVVLNHSRGNPFFAAESLRALIAADRLQVEHGRALLVGVDPPAARLRNTAVLHRFLTGGGNLHVARVLACFRRLSLRHLPIVAEITARDRHEVDDVLDALVSEQLIIETTDGSLGFAHPLLQETLYQDIGPAERRRIHQSIAEMLAAISSPSPIDRLELATHVAESADPGDLESWSLLVETGRSTEHASPLVAAEWYAKASHLVEALPDLHAETLAREARAHLIGQHPSAAADRGLRALAVLKDDATRRRTAAVVVNSLMALGDFQGCLEIIEEQLAAGSDPCPLLAQRIHVMGELGRTTEADLTVPEATRAMDGPPAMRAVAWSHLMLYGALTGRAMFVGECRDAIDALFPTLSTTSQTAVLESLALAHSTLGETRAASAALAKVADHRSAGAFSGGLGYESSIMLVHWLHGQWDEALEVASTASFDVEPSQAGVLRGVVRCIEAAILLERGATDRAAALAMTIERRGAHVEPFVSWIRARVHQSLGDPAGARTELERAWQSAQEGQTTASVHNLLETLIQVCLEEDDHPGAVSTLEELERISTSVGTAWYALAALRSRARVHGDQDAANNAMAVASEAGFPFELAKAQLLAAPNSHAAQDLLTPAWHTFHHLGAKPWRRLTEAQLRRGRHPVPRIRHEPHGDLTEAEWQVVDLVKGGLTNRQIASVLHYSVKTVEAHLTRIYAKTGCASRVALVRALDQLS